LSGRILDNDVHFPNQPEGWTVEAYKTVLGAPDICLYSTGNIPPVDTDSSGTVSPGDGEGAIQSFSIDVTSGGVPIDYVDITYSGDANTIFGDVGLGFDNFCPCSSDGLACHTRDTIQICNGEEAGFLDYTLDFWVENNTGYDISKLFIPGTVPGNQSTISPNVINYAQPIPAGTLIHVELNIDVPPGGYGPMEIPIGLMSKDLITGNLFECCATSVSFGYEFDDCNSNDIPDACEPDCNNNGIPDECDINSGTSNDCNNNGIPDGCENCNCCNLDVMRFGDPNGDGVIDIGDAIAMLGYLFNQVAINCIAAMDVNGDNQVDISDPIYELAYLFNMGAPPVGGTDCTPDADPADPPLECVNSGCP
ncbi:MAG: dockerin type I repeat-containing protein, partial [Planctomycetota bacterium]